MPRKSKALLPPSILEASPSAKDGVDAATEKRHRAWGCGLVLAATAMLRRPHRVGATAQTLLQRFFWRKSLRRFDAFTAAMACLLLAMKIEEELADPRLLRELLFAFHRLYQRRKGRRLAPMPLGGPRYTAWKARLMTMERHVLKELGFVFYGIIDHPHKYLLSLRNHLGLPSGLAQRAFAILNDSLFLDLGLRHHGQVIAAAAVFLAGKQLRVELPEKWWEIVGATAQAIGTITTALLEYYAVVERGEVDGWMEPLAEDSMVAEAACTAFDAQEEARGLEVL